MKRGFRIMSIIGIILIILVTGIFFGKDMIARALLVSSIKAMTGLAVKVESVNVNISNTSVAVKGLKVYNPKGFPDTAMVDIPKIFVQYNFRSLLKRNIHLPSVIIHLNEFVVIKDAQGKFNVNSIKAIQKAGEQKNTQISKPSTTSHPAEKKGFRIDTLELIVGKVIYKDYSQGAEPRIQEFSVAIDERYENITDPTALAATIVARALMKTTLTTIAKLDLRDFTKQTDTVVGKATETINKVTGALKDFF